MPQDEHRMDEKGVSHNCQRKNMKRMKKIQKEKIKNRQPSMLLSVL